MSLVQIRKHTLRNLIGRPHSYLNIYKNILSATTPTKFELMLYRLGAHEMANRRRLKRIMRRLNKSIGLQKAEARSTLNMAIQEARALLASAQRLNATSLGTQIREDPRYKILRKQLVSMEGNISETLAFVKKASAVKYPKNHINWAKVDPKVMPEVMQLDIRERTRIQQEWRMYTELLREVDRVHRVLMENKRLEHYTAFVEDLTVHFVEMYQEELYRVDERFELLDVLLKTQMLGEIDSFFQKEIREFPLEIINVDVQNMKDAVDEFEEPDFDFLARQDQAISSPIIS